MLRAGAGPESRVHGSLRVGGSSEHPQAARLRRPRLTPGGEESPETPREPPKLGRREGSDAARGGVGFPRGSVRGSAVSRGPRVSAASPHIEGEHGAGKRQGFGQRAGGTVRMRGYVTRGCVALVCPPPPPPDKGTRSNAGA